MSQQQIPFRSYLQDVRVVIQYAPLGIVKAVAERIGPRQMWVNTGFVTLNHNTEIEIVITVPGSAGSASHRIPALVSGCGEAGHSTLNFHRCSSEAIQALRPYFGQVCASGASCIT